MSTIASLRARTILDSRGEWTVEGRVTLENGISAIASVPQGKSRGAYEAAVLDPGEAVRMIEKTIAPALQGMDPREQKKIDEALLRLDGTKRKSRLGANAMLPVSIASARAAAQDAGVPLWKHIRSLGDFPPGKGFPRLFINVINGGLHAGSGLDIQEYLVIPRETRPSEAIRLGARLYARLKSDLLARFGASASLLGDEGGFAPHFSNNIEPFEMVRAAVEELGIADKIDLGIDAAASNIKMKKDELEKIYTALFETYRLFYLEDPFPEDDFDSFRVLKNGSAKELLIAGDDLTVTNVERMKKAHDVEAINAVIIKPNQIGTVSETLDAVRLAREYGWSIIVSHRSGETNDSFIADLAYAVGADGLKLGAPARGERIAKYNRLLEIEEEEQGKG